MYEVHPVDAGMRLLEARPPADPEPAVAAAVDAIWRREQAAAGGRLFDGRMFSLVDGRVAGGGDLRGCFVPYRRFLAQLRDPTLYAALRLRPVAVSGLVQVGEAILFGRRGAGLATDRGMWETVASGGIDDGARRDDGSIDYIGQFLRELEEEANLPADRLRDVAPFALVEDPASHVHEIAVAARVSLTAAEVESRFAGRDTDEYSDLAVVDRADLVGFLAANRGMVLPMSLALLEARGLAGVA